MLDSLTGFTVVGVAILVGWVIGRMNLLGEQARPVLARLTFFVLSPFLMFTVLSQADVGSLFSALLPVSALAAVGCFVVYALVAKVAWKRTFGETVVGMLSSGQVNAGNFGIPLALYLLGSAAFPAPVILFQQLVLTPITLTIMDAVTAGRSTLWRTLGRALRNPIIIGSVLGAAVSFTGLKLPTIVVAPLDLIADAAVPVLLISYGISLHGQRVLGAAGRRRDVVLASSLKLVVMPVIAWALAQFVFGLDAHAVLVVTVLAALPTAQNVFNYAQRYGVGETIARDTVFVTTLGCVPVLIGITLLLA